MFSGDLDKERAQMQSDTEKMFISLAKDKNGGISYVPKGDSQQRIEELEKENQILKNRVSELEEEIAAEEARREAGFGDMYVLEEYEFDGNKKGVIKQQIIDTDKAKALATVQKNNKEYKKKLAEMEAAVNHLRDKLGNKSVLLSILVDGIKDFAEEKSIEEAHTLFEHLCYILIKEKAWTNNVDDLKKFFKEAKKKESPIITLTGEHATYIENNKE